MSVLSKVSKYIIIVISVLMIIVMLFNFSGFFTHKMETDPEKERERIVSYLIQCYAGEGFYPPSLEYLEEHYGLILKTKEYDYFYDAFASNIMPDIIVSSNITRKKR